MPHEPYIREVPGSRQAVVLIHGILGTPDHFSAFLPLIPEDRSIYNILLDGHGQSPEDFSRSSMSKWQSQVSVLLDDLLDRYDQILLVGHSMGTLFSIQEAVRRPEKIEGLFLLQTPLRPWLKLRYACYAVVMPFGIIPEAARDMSHGTSIRLSRKLWKYIGWVPRFLELFIQCRRTRKILGQIRVPCRIYQCARDEMVSMRTCKDLAPHSHLQVTVLPNSGHFAYKGEDLELLKREFSQMFTDT